jgi:hypothetical protein
MDAISTIQPPSTQRSRDEIEPWMGPPALDSRRRSMRGRVLVILVCTLGFVLAYGTRQGIFAAVWEYFSKIFTS